MLAGEAVVAIWDGIAPGGARRSTTGTSTSTFRSASDTGLPAWPPLYRGRADTHPEFFTLYETDTMQVLQGSDYTNRLNQPTPWTKATTAHFRDTARALSRVVVSQRPGAQAARC